MDQTDQLKLNTLLPIKNSFCALKVQYLLELQALLPSIKKFQHDLLMDQMDQLQTNNYYPPRTSECAGTTKSLESFTAALNKELPACLSLITPSSYYLLGSPDISIFLFVLVFVSIVVDTA
jgi:hypothetical protein